MNLYEIILILTLLALITSLISLNTNRETYLAGAKLIEPANQFEGRWVGEDNLYTKEIRAQFDGVDEGVVWIDKAPIQFKYQRSTQGEYTRLATITRSAKESIVPVGSVFRINARDSGYMYMTKFQEPEIRFRRVT